MRLIGDALALPVDVLALLADVTQHLCGHFGQCAGAQTLEVLGFEFVRVEHVGIVKSQHWRGYPAIFQLLCRCR